MKTTYLVVNYKNHCDLRIFSLFLSAHFYALPNTTCLFARKKRLLQRGLIITQANSNKQKKQKGKKTYVCYN